MYFATQKWQLDWCCFLKALFLSPCQHSIHCNISSLNMHCVCTALIPVLCDNEIFGFFVLLITLMITIRQRVS